MSQVKYVVGLNNEYCDWIVILIFKLCWLPESTQSYSPWVGQRNRSQQTKRNLWIWVQLGFCGTREAEAYRRLVVKRAACRKRVSSQCAHCGKWMNKWTTEKTNEQTHEWTNEQVDWLVVRCRLAGWIAGWMNGRMDRWLDGMTGWMDIDGRGMEWWTIGEKGRWSVSRTIEKSERKSKCCLTAVRTKWQCINLII